MAKRVSRARSVEPCRKCNDPVFGRDWMETDGLCLNCFKHQEQNYISPAERININEDDPRVDR